MSAHASGRTGWTRLNVLLHWAVVLLILAQWIEAEWMETLWDSVTEGEQIGTTGLVLGYTHIVCGTFILAAALVRLLDRFVNGRPPYPASNPSWTMWLSKITHFGLYGIIIVMPALGLAAWWTGNDEFAHWHTRLWDPLLILAGLHILGALAEHFYFRTDSLAKMVPGLSEPRGGGRNDLA
ncbi:cytochrome b [Fulvimarina endophytica]|nr:cytochrome b/b6 domain-containing protein [Fulvimarina endophytica]